MKKFLLLLMLCFFFSIKGAQAKHLNLEKTYQNAWCNANCGKQEVILWDKTRIDCLTQTHAIEFDFASKWAESIGQSLYYGHATDKKPGIVLIMEDYEKDKKYLDRLNTVAKRYGITVWTMTPADLNNINKLALP